MPNSSERETGYKQAALEALGDFESDAADRQADRETRDAKNEKRKILKTVSLWIVLLACLTVIGFQTPQLISALTQENKPYRYGTFATDARTDACIQNLWKISAQLQQGRSPDKTLLCPASGKPFTVKVLESDIVVSTPHPEKYGFRAIRVSRQKPIPELIK